jgi:acyl-CoA hydrolase
MTFMMGAMYSKAVARLWCCLQPKKGQLSRIVRCWSRQYDHYASAIYDYVVTEFGIVNLKASLNGNALKPSLKSLTQTSNLNSNKRPKLFWP